METGSMLLFQQPLAQNVCADKFTGTALFSMYMMLVIVIINGVAGLTSFNIVLQWRLVGYGRFSHLSLFGKPSGNVQTHVLNEL